MSERTLRDGSYASRDGIEDVLRDIYEHNVEQWQALA